MSGSGFVALPDRALLRLQGPDRAAFLQALVTQDLGLLDYQPALYACLLTPQGKFLFDFFVIAEGETLLIDCEGGERAAELLKALKTYKLRSKVELALEDNVPVYALLPPAPSQTGFADPRHSGLGRRSLARPEGTEKSFEDWDRLRIALGIPDGSRDIIPAQSTLIECGIDRLHGVSFEKGCYIGQELTARMHHRGLAKKHLYPVQFDGPVPAAGDDIVADGHVIGQMRSSCGNIGLALLKDEAVQHLPDGLKLLSDNF